MSVTEYGYQNYQVWNLFDDGGSAPLNQFVLSPTSNSNTVVATGSPSGTPMTITLNGSFSLNGGTLANVQGTLSDIAVTKNGAVFFTDSYSNGADFQSVMNNYAYSQSLLTGNDKFVGTSAAAINDAVQTLSGNDAFVGYGDTVTNGSGGDQFYGGTGVDTSAYRGASNQYYINPQATIYDARTNYSTTVTGITVLDQVPNRDGFDKLVDVERLQFSDTNIAFDYQAGGHAGQAFRLYLGVLGRQGEPAGLGYVMDRLDQGETLKNVASGYLNSPEFQAKYGNVNQDTFINLLYKNILGRDADASGYQFIKDWMATGATREDVVLGFTESPEYIHQCAQLIGNNGIHYTPVALIPT